MGNPFYFLLLCNVARWPFSLFLESGRKGLGGGEKFPYAIQSGDDKTNWSVQIESSDFLHSDEVGFVLCCWQSVTITILQDRVRFWCVLPWLCQVWRYIVESSPSANGKGKCKVCCARARQSSSVVVCGCHVVETATTTHMVKLEAMWWHLATLCCAVMSCLKLTDISVSCN